VSLNPANPICLLRTEESKESKETEKNIDHRFKNLKKNFAFSNGKDPVFLKNCDFEQFFKFLKSKNPKKKI
jgi:hypothetical protein